MGVPIAQPSKKVYYVFKKAQGEYLKRAEEAHGPSVFYIGSHHLPQPLCNKNPKAILPRVLDRVCCLARQIS